MKTLLLYATKYGATREIAGRIAKLLPNTVLCDLKSEAIPSLAPYDCIVLGSPVYAGMIRKEVKTFAATHISELSAKKLGLFLSGLAPDEEKVLAYFDNNFPKEILQAAKTKAFLGGIFDPVKAGFFDKMLFKAVAKQDSYTKNIFEDKIAAFAETLKG